MATNTVGIDKEVEVNRKENLRDHRLYWIGRRTQDVILSSLALVVLSPVMLATAIAIVVDDPSAGPVFSQERIGRNGKPFKFYKFRSMCPNAEAKLDDLLDQNEMDSLTRDAISYVNEIYKRYKNESDLCGFSFLRGKPDGGYLSTSGVPQDGMKESYVECRINRGIGGDMAEVWYTHCLKEYLFPEFQGEKFLGEDIVWVRMSEKYKMRFFNRVIYVSDYLEDGLTNNRRKHNIKSPNGCVARAEAFLDSDSNIKAKIKAALQYQIYGKFAGVGEIDLFRKSKNKMMFIVFAVPARLLYWKWNFADQG